MKNITLTEEQHKCIFRYNQKFKHGGILYRSITPGYLVQDNQFQAMRAVNGGKLTGEKITFTFKIK